MQQCKGIAALGHDGHDRPVAGAKYAMKCFGISHTWACRIARMCVDPNAGELFGFSAKVHLLLKEVRYRQVIERYRSNRDGLLDNHDVFTKSRSSGRLIPKAPTSFSVKSRINTSFAHAYGLNLSTVSGSRRISLFIIFVFLAFLLT